MKKIIVFLMLATILTGCSMDIKIHKFDSYKDAKDIIERGWIPENIPTSATNIQEVHNLDSNKANGRFIIPKCEIDKFIKTLEKVDKKSILDDKFIETKWFNEKDIKEKIKNNKLTVGTKDDNIYAVSKNADVYYWAK